jgi:ATP-dependent Clp protease adaptor protein ClpS
MSIASPDIADITRSELDQVWKVVVHDDPVTPMLLVTLVFQKVFGYPKSKAEFLMLTVHHEGRAIVWSGERDRAENFCVALHTHGLLATVEREND